MKTPPSLRHRITSYNVCYTKLLRDPQRETIYEQIKKDLFSIADELGEYIKAYQVTDYQNIYSYYHQKIDLLLLLDNLKNDASNFETIFKRIWLTNKFNSEIKSAFIKIIDEEIDEGYKFTKNGNSYTIK